MFYAYILDIFEKFVYRNRKDNKINPGTADSSGDRTGVGAWVCLDP